MYITFLQISQMVAGVFITICGFIYARDPSTCGVVPHVLYFQGIIYGSYLYLFLEFLIKRFFSSSKPSSLAPSSSASTSNGGATATGVEKKGWRKFAAGEGGGAAAAAAANGSDMHLKKAQ